MYAAGRIVRWRCSRTVTDAPARPTVIQDADEASCSGRGLFLVSELASDFGIDHHTVGKTVWAAFKRPAAP
ncbi:hypothetical protein NW249_27460 [Streptomyces sp. OUCMDZ-4982]|uniref:hypothetical protein n=1 Tax=Streptomyces sp. OUCMDZ-4982 TaxID=2973090 RepID=UPI00215C8CFD|nr:hypothetical protein [Streptomyces sp. OUCMDZ-4982]